MPIGQLMDRKQNSAAPGSPDNSAMPVPVAAAPRIRRRPLWMVGSVIAVCLGGLVTVWAWSASSSASEVVAVRSLVLRGEVIERADLVTVRVGVDPALRVVPASRIEELAGRRASLDLAAGGLVTEDAVGDLPMPGQGMALVGVALAPGMLPAEPLRPGDRVQLVLTPGPQGDAAVAAGSRELAATVQSMSVPESGPTVVDVLVPQAQAAEVARQASTGRLALVLASRER